MVAPVYDTDLITLSDADTTTGWGGAPTGGAAITTLFTMQGAAAINRGIGAGQLGGMAYAIGSALTLVNDQHFYVMIFMATPQTVDTIQVGGVGVFAGDTRNNSYVRYHVDGSDTFGGGGRVGKVYPFIPNNTPSAVPPYRTVQGSPSNSPQFVGSMCFGSGQARYGQEAVRYGRGVFIYEGEVGDVAGFDAMAVLGDLLANRWGVFTPILGQYVLQGKLTIGQDPTGTPTLCFFEDSFKTIVVEENPHASTTFNEIIIDHSSTNCTWDFITVRSLSSTSRGAVTVTNNNPVFNVSDSVWQGIGNTTLQSNSVMVRVSWVATLSIMTNGASLTDCAIANNASSSAVVCSDLADLTTCSFTSSGSGHAVELDSLGSGSMIWSNTLTSYAGTDGSTGDEALFVNVASGNITISVADGATTPSVRTAGAICTVVAGLKTFTFTVNPAIVGYEWRIYEDDPAAGIIGTVELGGEESATLSTQSITYTPSAQVIALQIMANGYTESLTFYNLIAVDQNITINLERETNT